VTEPDVRAATERLLGTRLEPLAGGWSGETFLVDGPDGGQAVLRMFVRDPSRARVVVGLMRLVHGLLPVPRVVDARFGDEPGSPALVVTELLPGKRLDLVLAKADDVLQERLGIAVAELAVLLAGMPFAAAGSLHGLELAVEPWGGGGGAGVLDDLVEHVLEAASDADVPLGRRGLLDAADEAAELIDGVHRACLVHSDLNPKNVLVDPGSGTVTGLVDWEYAHAGAPVTDLGNLVRFGEHPVFERAVLARFLDGAPGLPPEPLDTARAVDLISLLDLGVRQLRGAGNPVARRALRRVQAIAVAGSVRS